MATTLVRVDNGQPFIASATEVVNSDGSVSYQLPGGGYGGQEPNAYGVRNDNPEARQYQRGTRSGATVTFLPVDGSLPCVYLVGSSQVYPA